MSNKDGEQEKHEGEGMKKWSQLVAKAWADEKLRKRLVDNPTAVLQEHGLKVPPGVEIRVVENTDKVRYLTLPETPAGELTELDEKQMEAVVGGALSTATAQPLPVKRSGILYTTWADADDNYCVN
jgi:hypothetical protein